MSAYDLIFRGWFSHLDPERIHAEVVAGLRVARAAGVTQLLAPAVRPSSTLTRRCGER